MNDLAQQRKTEIVALHTGIQAAARRSIQDAIRIGELLSEQKAELEHGEFTPWIERELPFSERAARYYMTVYRWRSKTANVADLSEAYRVAQIEDQRAEAKRAEDMRTRLNRGEGPPKDRADRRVFDKVAEDAAFEERKEKATRKAEEDFKHRERDIVGDLGPEKLFPDLDLDGLIEELRNRILGLVDISRRHAALNKIIKYMKQLAIECDRISVGRAG